MSEVKCGVVRDLMPLVADDVACEESKQLVNEHMEGCEVCKAYYAGMSAQLARMAMPEDDPTSTFVNFSHKMEKRVRMKRVLIALVAAVLALCVVVMGIFWIGTKMNEWVEMPTEKTGAWLFRRPDGKINILIKMKDGYGWHGWIGVNQRDSVVWITPYEPELILWNRGNTGFVEENMWVSDELHWEDGQLYYNVQEWHGEYDHETDEYREVKEERKIPLDLVRWGHDNDFTTLYEAGDEIPTYAELMKQLEAEGEVIGDDLLATPVPFVTPVVEATVTPLKNEPAAG